jgi:hypothetical protein
MGHGPHSSTFFFSLIVLFYVFLFVLCYVLFVCDCVLPPGDNPIAVNEYNNNNMKWAPDSHWVREWVSKTAEPYVVVKSNVCSCWEWNPTVIEPMVKLLHWASNLGAISVKELLKANLPWSHVWYPTTLFNTYSKFRGRREFVLC